MAKSVIDVVLTVPSADGQYHIESSMERDNVWPGSEDGVTTGEGNWMAVLTGTEWGPISVRVQLFDDKPDEVDRAWDMAVERDIEIEDDGERLTVTDVYAHMQPFVVADTPGLYRARIHVAGRDQASTVGDTTEPLERHLLQFWPTSQPAAADVLYGSDARSTRRR